MSTPEINPAVSLMGRRIRLAVIGGGPGSFIGAMHRQAARLTDCYDLTAAALSSRPEKARQAGRDLGLAEDRIYTDGLKLIESEAARPDGADAVAIMTPNDTHNLYASAALKAGLDVICDKPVTNTVEEAEALCRTVTETGRIFRLTHNYTGYPMVRQARAMVEEGEIGTIRLVQVEYVQGGNADGKDPDPAAGPLPWRYDPEKGGPSLVLGDIGSHAHHLVRYICGMEVTEVAAEAGNVVPGRKVQDFAGALMHLENGARGSFWVTQAAAGMENGLRIRVCGTKGTLEWEQEMPHRLVFKPAGRPWEVRTPGGPGALPLGIYSTHIAPGHPEGFPDGFANIYRDAAEAIAAGRSGKPVRQEAGTCPDVRDGLLGVRFIRAVLASSASGSAWTAVDTSVPEP